MPSALLLALCLVLGPLHKNFPHARIFALLCRDRREIGVTVFFYALLYASSFFMKSWILTGSLPWQRLLDPSVLPAAIALFFLLLLTLTSNDSSIRALGWKRWKALHRTVYLVEVAVLTHMLLQKGAVAVFGCLIFLPLFFFQCLRRKKIEDL